MDRRTKCLQANHWPYRLIICRRLSTHRTVSKSYLRFIHTALCTTIIEPKFHKLQKIPSMNPFGAPITNTTLTSMRKYRGKTVTQEDRAREAMRLIQAENKNMNALNHALNLEADYGNGVSTLILIYNATGDTLEIVEDQKKDWLGSVYKEEPPRTFENGQWISFLHVHPTSQSLGSEGARVIRGKSVDGQVWDYMVAWCAPWHGKYDNSAYTMVREKDYFPQRWNDIRSELENAKKITKDESNQWCASTVSIGGFTTSEFVAVLKHKFSQTS